MQLDISDVLREPGKFLPYDLKEPPLVDEDVECTAPIVGKLTFNNTGGLLLVGGVADTKIVLPCSRCESYFELPISFKVEEQFELTQQALGHRTYQTLTVIEEDENPIAGKLFEGHVLNLTEMLRQYILIESPTRPLPETLPDGKCSQCLKTAEEVLLHGLKDLEIEDEADPKINPAFAKLSGLLRPKETNIEEK